MTNGCFDLLHAGHIYLLNKAKKLGDILILAVNDDASIKKLKGVDRPVFTLDERLEVLVAITVIDYLIVFSQETPLKLISTLLPDVLVKGGDWKPNSVVGKAEVERSGGKLTLIPFRQGHSSSDLIDRIQNSVRRQT